VSRLKTEYGVRYLADEDEFYKLYKMRRVDLLAMADENGPEIIEKVMYADDVQSLGRRGV